MSLRQAIFSRLSGLTAITDLVGTAPVRVYSVVAPQATALPYITYNQISSEHESHMGGAVGLARTTIQFDVWDDSEFDTDTLADALREALYTFSGTMGSGGFTSTVQSVDFVGDIEDYEAPKDASELGTFGRKMDFAIWHTESVPA